MQAQWQKILVKLTFWLLIEILLNILGLDSLADYSEFVFEGRAIAVSSHPTEVVIAI